MLQLEAAPSLFTVLWEYSRLLAQEQATLDPQYLEAQAQYDAYVKERGTLPERFVNSALLPAELKRRVRRHLGLPACEACAVCPRGSQAGSIVFAWPAQPSTAPAAASGRLPTFYCCRLPSDATLTCDPAHALQPRVTWMGPEAHKPIAEQLQQLQADKKVDTVAAAVKLKGKMTQRRQKELAARGQEDAQRRMQVVSGCLL